MKNRLRNFYVLLCTLVCLFLTNQVHSQQTLTQINGWNAYVHLPANYNSTTVNYPTIIFFPGLGEVGTNAAAVIANGPGAYITQGWNGNVVVDGNTVEFIIISIQPSAAYPNEISINQKIQTIKSLYRVNNNKLYLTGLSHGGWCSTTFVTGDNLGGPYTYASQIAAVVEVEGVQPDDNSPYPNLFDNYANAGGRLLGFEQIYDNRGMPTRVNRMNATKPGSAIFIPTSFGNGGHCCWNQFYGGQGLLPGNFMLDGVNQNLYQWLARQSLGTTVNQAPVANAGADKTIALPTSTSTLDGSGTDSDGSISSYQWTKISGPASGNITNANVAQANLTALAQGVYQYQLKVTDNSGNTNTDQVQVTVNALANTAPVSNAGSDQSIVLPANSASLSGTGSDADGTITSYLWTKLSGPIGGAISNTASASTTVTALVQGTYTYELKVTDNAGAISTDNIIINVNAAPATPPAMACNTNAPVTYTLAQTAPGEIYRPKNANWKGGDTIKITGTSYSIIEFYNIGGDACRPLVIMPMTTLVTPTLRFKGNCRYIKLWGGNTPYGIKINAGPLAISSSHHIEADNIECSGGNTGVYCKQDVDYADTMTWHPNYRMTKFTFKNMWIHDINGEGMYVGITAPSGFTVKSTRSGLDTVILPIRLDSVEISNCLVERTTWDGIQLSNARNGNKIFNNIVRNYGTLNLSSQQAGIILGGNCNGDIYGNTVIKGTGNGIQVFGYGVINVYSNTLDSCGHDGIVKSNGIEGQQSIYASDYITGFEVNPKQTINVYNNVIKHPKNAGAIFITGYANNSFASSVYNNTFCIPNAATNWQNTYLKLLVVGSTNTNNTLSCTGISNALPTANAGGDNTLTLPVNSLTVTGSGTDTDGTISSYLWTKVSGPAATIISAASTSTVINSLVQGIYKFELKVTDNNGSTGTDTVQIIVNTATVTLLPAINPANTVNGLDYKYYEGNWSAIPEFSSLTPVKTGTTTNFDISLANKTTQFGFSFTGFITVPADGVYTFYTISDDGSNLLIDNVLTVMNDGLHSAIEKSGTIGLKAGKHAITGLFFEQGGDHIFSVSYEGMGITKQTIPSTSLFRVSATNILPIANAGNNINITLPVNTTNLLGSGTDADGTIASYNWYLISGPAGSSITSSNAAVATISNLLVGTYSYNLTVTDNNGATAKDTVTVIVNAAAVTLLPAVTPANTVNGLDYKYYEGNWSVLPEYSSLTPVKTGTTTNFDISLANRITQFGFSFSGFITVPADGVYTFYTTSDDGSNLLIDNVLTVSNDGLHAAIEKSGTIGLKAGKHAISGLFFEQAGDHIFTVSYEGMGIAKQTIPSSILYRVSIANTPPVANAGPNQNVASSTVTLAGNGTDADGTIASYLWTLLSGPNGSSFSNVSAASTTVTGLVQGTYQFQLKVTDNSGATATSLTQVIVNTTTKTIRVNVYGGTNPFTDTKWNNWNIAAGLTSQKFSYDDASLSNINASITASALVTDNGANYAGTSTVCPPEILRYNSANTSNRTLTLSGLNKSKQYSIEFYASRSNTGNSTVYSIGNKSDTISTSSNIDDYAKFFDIVSTSTGSVTVNLSRIGTWNYLAGFSIIEEPDAAAANVSAPESAIAPSKQIYQGETITEMGANAVSVYPNPFSGSFKVQINNKAAGEYMLKLSATSGQTVYYKKVNKTSSAIVEAINVNNLPAGTYILQIISVATGIQTVHKVIKK